MALLSEQIDELRSQGKYAAALRRLLEARNNLPDPYPVYDAFRRHFLGMRTPSGDDRPCLVLEGAARGQGTEILELWDENSALWSFFPGDRLRPMAEGRRLLIEAAGSGGTAAEIEELILRAVRSYRKACPLDAESEAKRLGHDADPAFIKRLPKRWEDRVQRVEQQWRRECRRGDMPDWDDPALLLAGDTLAYLLNPGQLESKGAAVETWVLLAQGKRYDRFGHPINVPEGLLARLVVEKVPGGSGLLYPDCRYSGYLPLNADFQQGLRNIMAVLRRRDDWTKKEGFAHDYRWRLIPLSPLDAHNLPVLLESVGGRSAEVAYACAVRAAVLGERLDLRAAATACFAEPGAAHENLDRVEGIIEKILAVRNEPVGSGGDFGLKGQLIDQIVVAEAQGAPQSKRVHDWTVRFPSAAAFDDAYRILSQHCRTTDRIKAFMAERAQRLLAETCHPYVRSSLSDRRPGDPSKQEPPEVPVALPTEPIDEVAAILHGELGQHLRTRLLAESGLGKSTMLIEAEYLIAAETPNLVPLRLGAGPAETSRDDQGRWVRLPLLSDFGWEKETPELLKQLSDRLLTQAVPNQTERSAWLQTAAARGEVVFLLDALDQTDKQLDLASFSKAVPDCPILLSARPETRRTRSRDYAGIVWRTLWVDPFDEERIKEFWGDAPQLDELLKNDDWKPLREVPVLLQQMKRLAHSGSLHDLPNREAVYHATLEMLVQHGHGGLEDAGQHESAQHDLVTVERFLSAIAWKTIQQEAAERQTTSFTGELAGEAYADFYAQHQDELNWLDQLNLTTRQTYLDEYGIGREQFAWRHLSFCEWFAGLHLASLPQDQQESVIRAHALDERWRWILRYAVSAAHRQQKPQVVDRLATCLLKYGGAFRLWEIIDPDGDRVRVHERLDTLCRWLVHRSRDSRTSPWRGRGEDERPVVDDRAVAILDQLFALDDDGRPLNRDSRWLHPAWQLVVENLSDEATVNEEVRRRCRAIRDRFLGEYEHRVRAAAERCRGKRRSTWSRDDAGLLQLVPDEHLHELGLISAAELEAIRRWPNTDGGTYEQRRDTFNRRLKEAQANFCQCPPEGWEHPHVDGQGRARDPYECFVGAGKRKRRRLPEFYQMGRGPVTNLQFEAFDPEHRRYRRMEWRRENETDENALDDHPVVDVSGFQVQMFCVWLTGRGAFGKFRLPLDDDWEACCRAGRDRGEEEFGIPWCDKELRPILDDRGNEQFDSLSSHGANFNGGFPGGKADEGPYRKGTIPVGQFLANGFGLVDMHGQVWEWMGSERDSVQVLSLRGGSWYDFARDARASVRSRSVAGYRNGNAGFRLTRTR